MLKQDKPLVAALCVVALALLLNWGSLPLPQCQAPYPQADSKEPYNSHYCDLWNWLFKDSISFFTGVLAILTGVVVFYNGRQIRLSRDEFLATHRPEIILREPRFEWVDGEQIVWFFLVNRGDGAGTVIDSRIGLEHHEDIGPALNMLCNGSNDLGHIALASGEVRECKWIVPGAIQMMRVAAEVPTLGLLGAIYLMGSLDYVDGSGRRRRTVFCRKYDPRRRRFVPTGDPEHEYAD